MNWQTLSNRFISYFVRGLLLLGPVYFTGYIIYSLIEWIDSQFYVYFPGSGLLIALAVVVGVGFIGSTFIVWPVWSVIEQLINRLPLVRIIYSSLKDLISAFVGDKKKFNQPVLVQLDPHSNLLRLGFITQTDLSDLALPEAVAVYLPQSYAFAGDLFIVPRNQVTPLDARATDVMKFIVSGGVSKNETHS
jgi:uncharacterized membrane protein